MSSSSNLSNGSHGSGSGSHSSGSKQTSSTAGIANTTSSNKPNTGAAAYNIGVLHSGNKVGREHLLKKIGGKTVLHKAVDEFYDRLVTDPNMQVYFRNANLQVLKWHQFNLMSIAFNNVPQDFNVDALILDKHTKLFEAGLDEYTYDLVLEHFSATLLDLDVPPDTVQEAVAVVAPLRASFARGAQMARERKRREKQRSRQYVVLLAVGVVAAIVSTTWFASRRKRQVRL